MIKFRKYSVNIEWQCTTIYLLMMKIKENQKSYSNIKSDILFPVSTFNSYNIVHFMKVNDI